MSGLTVDELHVLMDGLTLLDLDRCRWTSDSGERCEHRRAHNWTTCSTHRKLGEFDTGVCETRLGRLCSQLVVAEAAPERSDA